MNTLRGALIGFCCFLLLACGADGGESYPLKITLLPGSVFVSQFTGQTRALRVRAQIEGSVSGPAQVLITDSAGVMQGDVKLEATSSGSYLASFSTRPSLSAGLHQGTLDIRICEGVSCQQLYGRASLPYEVIVGVESETHLAPLSPWTGIGDWTTFQGDSAHRGYVPVRLDPARFSYRWLWSDPNQSAATLYTTVSVPVSVSADGVAYLVSTRSDGTSSVLSTLRESDGSMSWSTSLGANWASDPAVAAGKLYVATVAGSDHHVWALDARTGGTTFRSLTLKKESGARGPAQPVIVDQTVYVSFGQSDGWPAETQAVDASSGAVVWSVASGGYYKAAPAVDSRYLYFYKANSSYYTPGPGAGAGFTALDRASGTQEFTVVKPPGSPTDTQVSYRGSSPVLTGNGWALVNRNPSFPTTPSLDCIDLGAHRLVWDATGEFVGTPAVAGDVVYIGNNNFGRVQLEARNLADGKLRWQWSPSLGEHTFIGSVVATDNLVFVSTNQAVYAIDIEKRSAVWSYPVPGLLSLSASGILYIVRFVEKPGSFLHDGKVAAINLR